ncbi:hypothetical protein NZK32_07935 [Cyanobium sp. FGCU-52]|nr:hypothetical protein [Cyanobium sp. FGCU52]
MSAEASRIVLKLWSYCTVLPDNVLFFDRRTGSASHTTQRLWVYDLRTNQHFNLKTRPLQRADLDEFVARTRSASITSGSRTTASSIPTTFPIPT